MLCIVSKLGSKTKLINVNRFNQHNISRKRMKPIVVKSSTLKETLTSERCFIYEYFSSEKTSLARARVRRGLTTVPHYLEGVDEIYLITFGKGMVYIGNNPPSDVTVGDVVYIPAGMSQCITNTGNTDLIFYCFCAPRFTEGCYHLSNGREVNERSKGGKQ